MTFSFSSSTFKPATPLVPSIFHKTQTSQKLQAPKTTTGDVFFSGKTTSNRTTMSVAEAMREAGLQTADSARFQPDFHPLVLAPSNLEPEYRQTHPEDCLYIAPAQEPSVPQHPTTNTSKKRKPSSSSAAAENETTSTTEPKVKRAKIATAKSDSAAAAASAAPTSSSSESTISNKKKSATCLADETKAAELGITVRELYLRQKEKQAQKHHMTLPQYLKHLKEKTALNHGFASYAEYDRDRDKKRKIKAAEAAAASAAADATRPSSQQATTAKLKSIKRVRLADEVVEKNPMIEPLTETPATAQKEEPLFRLRALSQMAQQYLLPIPTPSIPFPPTLPQQSQQASTLNQPFQGTVHPFSASLPTHSFSAPPSSSSSHQPISQAFQHFISNLISSSPFAQALASGSTSTASSGLQAPVMETSSSSSNADSIIPTSEPEHTNIANHSNAALATSNAESAAAAQQPEANLQKKSPRTQYRDELARKNGFNSYADQEKHQRDELARKKGFASRAAQDKDQSEKLARDKGFKTFREYKNHQRDELARKNGFNSYADQEKHQRDERAKTH